MTLAAPGSVKLFMDAVVALETQVAAAVLADTEDELRVYRWRPLKVQLPCIYNWLPDAPANADLNIAAFRDTLILLPRIAIRHTDVNEEMATLEAYADIFRDVVDTALDVPAPLNMSVVRAKRTGMRTIVDAFGAGDQRTEVLCLEFRIQADLDRLLRS